MNKKDTKLSKYKQLNDHDYQKRRMFCPWSQVYALLCYIYRYKHRYKYGYKSRYEYKHKYEKKNYIVLWSKDCEFKFIF